MKIGMIGLGKMGANMTERLLKGGHEVVAYDLSADAVKAAAAKGAEASTSLADLAAKLDSPRAVWVMLPAGHITDSTVEELAGMFAKGDVIIDGGNSNYKEWKALADKLESTGVGFVDAGTSGGVWGLTEGYCLMVGGTKEAVAVVEPALLHPGARGRLRPRRPRRCGPLREDGAQRHGVRAHAGLRRGLRNHGQGRRVRPRPARDRLHLALRLGGAQLAVGSGRAGAAARGGLRRHQGRRRRLGRGPLDGPGGHRPGRAGAGDRHVALHPLRLAGARLAPAQDALRAAQPVRWPRRDARIGRAGPGDRDPLAVPGRRHAHPRRRRRPRLQRRRARRLRGAPGPALRAGAVGRPDGAGLLRAAGHGRRHRLGPGRHFRRRRARGAAR